MNLRLRTLAAASPMALAIATASALALSPSSAAANCTPTPAGHTGSSSRTSASGVQLCQGGETGIAYEAFGGPLTVNLNNDPVTGHAINISDDGGARNITLNIGLASAGYAAAPILANDSGANAVKIGSSGGSIDLTSQSGGPITYTGAGSPSYAVNLQTTGGGAITAVLGDALTDATGSGMVAQGVNGDVSLTANANVTAAINGVWAHSAGAGAASVTLGAGASIATPQIGLYAYSAGGQASATVGQGDDITAAAASLGAGVYVESLQNPAANTTTATALVGANSTITVAGTNSAGVVVTNQGQGLGGVSVTIGDGVQLTATGDDSQAVYAGTTLLRNNSVNGAGAVAVQLGSNDVIAVNAGSGVQQSGGSGGVVAASQGGDVSIIWTGTGGSVSANAAGAVPTSAIYATTAGAGTATIVTGLATTVESGAGNGIGAGAVDGAISVTAQGDVTASGGDAINAIAYGSGAVTVTAGSAANPVTLTTTPNNDAVFAASAGGGNVSIATYGTASNELLGETSGAGAVTIVANGTINPAASQAAIYAASQDGAISVTTNGTLTNSIIAQASGAGAVTVTTTGTVTAPAGDSAIFAASGSGDVSVTTAGQVGQGIAALTGGTGTVTITTNGAVLNTQPIDSVYASTVDGAVTVTAQAGTITGAAGGDGINAEASGAGAANVILGNGVTIDPPRVGVFAYSNGGVASLSLGANDSVTAADTLNSIALDARSSQASATAATTASILTGAGDSFTVTGNVSAGILATNVGGGLGGASVTTGAGNAITVTGDTDAGIVAATSILASGFGVNVNGAGPVAVNIGAGNTVLVNAGTGKSVLAPISSGIVAASGGGDVDVQWTGAGGSVTVSGSAGVSTVGLLAESSAGGSGGAALTVTTGAGTAITSNNGVGVLAGNANSGATLVTSNGAIVATATGPGDFGPFGALLRSGEYAAGMLVYGAGAVSVGSNAAITVSGGDGIDAISGGALNLTNAGTIVADQTAISAQSGGVLAISTSAPVQGAGTSALPVINLGSVGAASVTNAAGGVIASTAGAPTDLAVLVTPIAPGPPSGAVTLANAGLIVGRLDLSQASGATISNSGTWRTSGASAFPSVSSLANSGVIAVTGQASLAGLQTLTNTGVIDLRGASGVPGDSLTIGGAFAGAGSGQLMLNAALGVAGSGAGCGALADCLQVGSSSGVTSVVVRNAAPAGAAGPNSAGVLIVSGASSGANFVLDPTSTNYDPRTHMLDEGLFSYALGYNAQARQERLYGLPGGAAFDLPSLITAAQTIWYETAPWQDRQADFHAHGGPGPANDPQVWLQAVGAETQRTAYADYAIPGVGGYRFATSYNQQTGGLVGGVDVDSRPGLTPGDHLLAGMAVGYVTSHVAFSSQPVAANASGAVLAVYGSYLNRDGVFVDASLNTNQLRASYEKTGVSGFEARPDVSSLGGWIDLGRRWSLARAYYVEPLASLTYLSAHVESAGISGASVDFGAGRQGQDSGRGGLGVRVGAEAQPAANLLIDGSLTAQVWNEFAADNKATISSGGAAVTLQDRFTGAFGEVSGRLAAQNRAATWLGSVGAAVQFKDGYTSETLSAELRYRW